jgi:flagellar protein FlgJ
MLYVNPYESNAALRFGSPNAPEREKAALEEFEQVFLREMMKSMRKTVPDGGLFPQSQQKSFFDDMLDDHLAREMAHSGQLGVAKQIQAQLDATRKNLVTETRPVAPVSLAFSGA